MRKDPRYPDGDKYGYKRKAEKSYRETVGEEVYRKRERAFLKDNYTKYTKEPLRIGFTHDFPEHADKSKVIDEIVINNPNGNSFKVRFGEVTFGEDNKYSCKGITTDRFEIPRKGPMGGWGSHGYADEAAIMEMAIVEMAAKHNMFVCNKVCSWPFAKAVVSEITEAHVRCYEPKEEVASV